MANLTASAKEVRSPPIKLLADVSARRNLTKHSSLKTNACVNMSSHSFTIAHFRSAWGRDHMFKEHSTLLRLPSKTSTTAMVVSKWKIRHLSVGAILVVANTQSGQALAVEGAHGKLHMFVRDLVLGALLEPNPG